MTITRVSVSISSPFLEPLKPLLVRRALVFHGGVLITLLVIVNLSSEVIGELFVLIFIEEIP